MGASVAKHSSLFDSLPSLNQVHIVMLGLDCSGKTTILYRLKFGQYLNTVPTIGFNCEKIKVNAGKPGKTVSLKVMFLHEKILQILQILHTSCIER